ncbi:MAG: lytic transglycosylase domain-containing protein, partial [Dermatophilaceae bacterium]
GMEPFTEDGDDTGAFDIGGQTSTGSGFSSGTNTSTSGFFSNEEADILSGIFGGGGEGGGGVGGSRSRPGDSEGYAMGGPGVTVEGDLGTFMSAIRRLESGSFGGDYSARGPVVSEGSYAGERAMGAYQIMPGNWAPWAREAGIAGADWRDPAAQDRVAAHKFQEYYGQFGSWEAAAVAWFAGPSRARRFAEGQDLSGISDDVGTDVPSYVKQIQQYMGQLSSNVEPAGGLDGMPQSEGQPSGGSMSVGAAMPSLSASQTRQVNVKMDITIERASREEAERLAEMVRDIVRQEEGINMVATR